MISPLLVEEEEESAYAKFASNNLLLSVYLDNDDLFLLY
jgi:hypothetical protein